MLSVLSHLTYRRLFGAQVVSLVGTGLATVALSLLAYDLAGADAGRVLGTAYAIKMIAYVVLAPVMAAAISRLPATSALVGADVLRFAVAAALPFVDQVWQVYALILVMQAAAATFTPTFQALIPRVLPDEEEYTKALSLSRLAYDLEAVGSPALAGLVLLFAPYTALFAGTAAGFLASGALVLSASVPRFAPPEKGPGSLAARLARGAVVMAGHPVLRAVLVVNLAIASAGAFVLVQTVVVVQDVLGLAEWGLTLALVANGAGSMAAAIAIPRVLARRPERQVMTAGGVMMAGGLALATPGLALGPPAGMAVLCAAWIVVGAGWSAAATPIGRLIRRHVDDADLAPAFSAQFSLSHACWLVAYLAAGLLGSAAGLAPTALALAGVAFAAIMVAAAIWPPAEVGAASQAPPPAPKP